MENWNKEDSMIREELKKIWKLKMVFILIFLGFVFYTMFLEFHIQHFPNGPQSMGVFDISKDMVEKYGTSLSLEEIEKVKRTVPELYQEADRYLQELDLAKKHGIASYQEYLDFSQASLETVRQSEAADQNADYADLMRIQNYLTSPETENIGGRIYGVESLLQKYEMEKNKIEFYRNSSETKRQIGGSKYSKKEWEQIGNAFYNETEDWQNILPDEVVEVTAFYLSYLLVWICLSICILISPLLVSDRMSRMRSIQYSSKRGRKLIQIQFQAVMLSAFLLTTLNLVLFGGIFMTNGTKAFFLCRMYSFAGITYCWTNWTYGTWCLLLIGLSYLVAMGTAGIVFFLSRYSTNYIGMLLKLVPLFVVTAILCLQLLYQAFYYNNTLYRITQIPYMEGITAIGLFLVGIGLCIKKMPLIE